MLYLSFSERAKHTNNPTAKALLSLMETKQTNLCLSADLMHANELLALAEKVAPEICVLKTHADIIKDFSETFVRELRTLSQKYGFFIFEDRKFADIGNTVKAQYANGVHHIADWAPITNAHILPGPGIIEGLKSVGLPKGNGLLLLAEMSSKGNLLHQAYTEAAVEMAKQNKDFVIGFISQHRLIDDPAFIHFTPGVNLATAGDSLGQQYVTPQQAIQQQGVDIIIVGRGIYEAPNPAEAAKAYRTEGWEAYRNRVV